MSKTWQTEVQLIGALKQVEAGPAGRGHCAGAGRKQNAIYVWNAKCDVMDNVSNAEEVTHLRDDKVRLRKLVADLILDKDTLQSVIRKLPWLVERRSEVRRLQGEFKSTERRVCELMEMK